MSETIKTKNEQEAATADEWQDMKPTPSESENSPSESTPDEHESEAPLELNLDSAEWDDDFAQAETFVKKGRVTAVRLTEEGLKSGEYADRDIRWDEEKKSYVVDTWVMQEKAMPDGSKQRVAVIEDTHTVSAGDWVLTNPVQQEGDHLNNYPQDNETFTKSYEPDERSDQSGVYRAKGTAKIFRNPTSKPVFIHKWGTIQEGDAHCYFCERHTDGKTSRYLLSENDFAAYEPYQVPDSAEAES